MAFIGHIGIIEAQPRAEVTDLRAADTGTEGVSSDPHNTVV
jgi:hypothetical protein